MSKKSKANRVARLSGELEQALRDQLELMQISCKNFDEGARATGKLIALNLRVLLHEKGQSRALLQQLGIRDIMYLDTASEFDSRNLAVTMNLVTMKLNVGGATEYVSAAAEGLERPAKGTSTFTHWWNKTVICDAQQRKFSRQDLVLNVADTDGGAHVDPDLEEAYMELSRKNSLGWRLVRQDGEESDLNDPVIPSIRQIGYEVLATLYQKHSEYFDGPPYLFGTRKL